MGHKWIQLTVDIFGSSSSYSILTVSSCSLLCCFIQHDASQLSRLHLHAAFPSRHMYSVFALVTFISLSSQWLPIHGSISNSSTSYSLAHSTTSSANIISQGTFSVSEGHLSEFRKLSIKMMYLLETNKHCLKRCPTAVASQYAFVK